MTADNKDENNFLQNLKDAGCDSKTTQRCLCFFQERKFTEVLQALAAHRAELLEEIHGGQERIDCLDFLIYKIKKEMVKRSDER